MTEEKSTKRLPQGLGVRARFALLLAIIILTCMLALLLVWGPRLLEVMATAQLRSLDQKVAILSDALVPFLLQNQFGAVFETLDSMMQRHDNWLVVMLADAEGRQLYPLAPTALLEGDNLIRAEKLVVFEGRRLAMLTVQADITADLALIRDQILSLVVLIVLFFGGVMLVMGLSLERWILRPVALLADAAGQLARGNYQAQMPIVRGDEIGRLTNSFAQMRGTIRENEASLIASRDEAQDAAEAKSRFLATMSHEIRTPLNGVIPLAELLLEGELNPGQRQLVSTIRESGRSLKTLIDDILDIAKFDEEKFVIKQVPFSPEDLVNTVVNMMQAAAQSEGLSLLLEVNIDQSGLRIGDQQRLRQVLVNLIGNALKFTQQGHVKLRVSAGPPISGRQWTSFEVTDTGIGISDRDLDRIFERFVQVDDGSNREYQGSGLGLSICRLLVDAMGGTLRASSTPGLGSTFSFCLPLEVAAEGAEPAPYGPEERLALLPRKLGAEAPRILVVDDSRANLRVAQVVLQSLGYAVVPAKSGLDALQQLEEDESIALVLMDVNMPGLDGLATTRRIRDAGAGYSDLPVLGLSASAFEEDIAACREAGMDGFLPKPLSKTDLALALDKHLAPAAQQATGTEVPDSPEVRPLRQKG